MRTRTSLGAMAQAGSAFRGWGREHPRAGKGLRSHPGESPAPSRGPLLPLPLLTHCLVHGAPEEEPPVPSPATPSLGCGRPQRWGQKEEATKGRSGDPVAFPRRAFLPAAARRGHPGERDDDREKDRERPGRGGTESSWHRQKMPITPQPQRRGPPRQPHSTLQATERQRPRLWEGSPEPWTFSKVLGRPGTGRASAGR